MKNLINLLYVHVKYQLTEQVLTLNFSFVCSLFCTNSVWSYFMNNFFVSFCFVRSKINIRMENVYLKIF